MDMKTQSILIGVALLGAVALIAFIVSRPLPEPTTFAECADRYPVMESFPRQCITPSGLSFTEEDTNPSQDIEGSTSAGIPDLIEVDAPLISATVSSPLSVTGRARGMWYFEASFPIEVRDAGNNVIGSGIAQAQGDWMTTDFVPFTANISYTAQTPGSLGTLVLKKDNPSGEPANDQSLVIPITF